MQLVIENNPDPEDGAVEYSYWIGAMDAYELMLEELTNDEFRAIVKDAEL